MRYEYFYINRYIIKFYVGTKRLFRPWNVKKKTDGYDRAFGTLSHSGPVRRDLEKFSTEKFFRVISLKSVMRYEYFYINRYIIKFYVGIKRLFRPWNVKKKRTDTTGRLELRLILDRYVGT
jgi:calcineurin-like phosphoesterase